MSKNYSKTTESGNKINTPENIKEDKSFQILKLALDEIKEKYKIAPNEILSLVEEKPVSKEILLPISIFKNEKLSALESICKYLKEELDVGFNKIDSKAL